MSHHPTATFSPAGNCLAVTGVGIWLPGANGAEQLPMLLDSGCFPRQQDVDPPTGTSIEPRARRRASRLSRALADVCAEASQQAQLDRSGIATVFGSTLGEAHTMITLLGQMWRHEEMSPMGFATSVHSAASSVVSINAGNRAFTTSLSADYDTAAGALFEAWGVVQTMALPTVIACGDDHSPEDFVPDAEAFDLVAVALSLSAVETCTDDLALGYISLPHAGEATLPGVASSPQVGRNPQAGLLDVAAHLLAGKSGTVRLDRGSGSGLVVAINPR